MKLESIGIIIGIRPFGERDAVARIFTRDHGVLAGMIKGAQTAKKNRPLVGQCGNASWNARLDCQLGVFHFESDRNLAAPLMSAGRALACMNSAFALLAAMLPEREPYPDLFENTVGMLASISRDYTDWEIRLLRALGYALDLSKCSNCGRDDDLKFLSKRTGRAVCSDCAAPYIDKVFPLPIGLATTEFFLSRAAADMGAKLPVERTIISK